MVRFVESLHISSSEYVNAAVAVLFFVFLARAADYLIDKAVRRFTRFTRSDLDDRIIDAVHRPVYHSIIVAGLVQAVLYLDALAKSSFYINGALYSMLAFIWAFTLVKVANAVIGHAVHKVSDATGLGREVVPLAENVSKIAITIAALMVVLSIWKVDITPVLASSGIAGVAVAIAAKDTLSNFFGGVSVFLDRPFKIGDYIVLDKGERGEVVAIGLRSTRIKTRDDVLISIPNAIITSSKIINESAPIPHFRVRIPLSVAYGSDIDLVEKTLLEAAAANENVIQDPPPRVRFREFGDNGLHYELLCWAKEPSLRGLTVHELNRAIYGRFGELGITFPFPQRDVHVHEAGQPRLRYAAKHQPGTEK